MDAPDGPDAHADEAMQALLDGALGGALNADERARLNRHLAACPSCAAELEARRVFESSLAPGPGDEALDLAAVAGAMARLGAPAAKDAHPAVEPRDEALDHAAVERAMARLGGPSRTRPRSLWRPTAFAALGAAAAAAVALFAFQRPGPTSPAATAPPAAPAAGSAPPFTLVDGSQVAPENAATAIEVGEQTAARTLVRLPSGAARFRVRHDARRVFRVDAGLIEIEDLGTVFRVAHEPGGRVRVTVSEGRVAVRSTVTELRLELGAGDDRVFEGAPPAPEPAPVALHGVPGAARAPARPRLVEDPAGLLAAADVARRSRQPQTAAVALRRLVERYPKDPRAPSAAFTLAWVYLTDLNRPREAAVAFAEAERIAPRGALAEDAAARVAEAWQKAGEPRRAAEAARHYAQAYPGGRYSALMRGLIGDR